jgi:hypothetical protein
MQYFIVGFLLVSIILCSGWFIFFYDKTAYKKAKIEDIGRQINELIKLKHDLIWECVEMVFSSAKQQEEILVTLSQLRNDILNTQTSDESKKISKEVFELLNRFFVNKGTHPDIETEYDLLDIWQRLEELEGRIFLKQKFFTEEVFLYNRYINAFPNAIASRIMNIKQMMVQDLTH